MISALYLGHVWGVSQNVTQIGEGSVPQVQALPVGELAFPILPPPGRPEEQAFAQLLRGGTHKGERQVLCAPGGQLSLLPLRCYGPRSALLEVYSSNNNIQLKKKILTQGY